MHSIANALEDTVGSEQGLWFSGEWLWRPYLGQGVLKTKTESRQRPKLLKAEQGKNWSQREARRFWQATELREEYGKISESEAHRPFQRNLNPGWLVRGPSTWTWASACHPLLAGGQAMSIGTVQGLQTRQISTSFSSSPRRMGDWGS